MEVSICITVKNRSRIGENGKEILLFPNCVRSIVKSIPPGVKVELVVADWYSDDYPLAEWIGQTAAHIPVQIIAVTGAFNRGKGLNIAAKAAKSNYLFFMDADCLLSPEVLVSGIKNLKAGKTYFPVFYAYTNPDHSEGEWIHYAFGQCMVTKDMWKAAGEWPEYPVWGKEDNDFYARIAAHSEIIREEVPGFYHQWHPDDIVWKNRYSEHAAEIAHEVEQVKIVKQELNKIIPTGATIILVDEGRFGGIDCMEKCRIIPFTELDGEYGGHPADSESAINEFERLVKQGPSFLVFAWMTFWWLDYYLKFQLYLRSKYVCTIENENLIIFDLNNETA